MKTFVNKYVSHLLQFPYNILSLILAVALIIRTINLNYNSIFLDEAFYIVIGQKILSGRIDEALGDISWVGAFPLLYPFFSAIFYAIGGLLGTRFFTVILGTISIGLIFYITKSLRFFQEKRDNEVAGLIAAAFMATATIPLASSRLAIYDGLSFTFFLSGLALYLKANQNEKPLTYLSSSIAFFLSFLAKYITIIFFPFLLLPLLLKRVNIRKVLFYFGIPIFLLPVLYVGINFSNLVGYISGQVGNPETTYLDVLNSFWQYSNILYLLVIGGLIVASGRKKYTVLVLLLASFIPMTLHLVTRNNDSAHQHVFFSIVLILPVVGMFFTQTIKSYGKFAIAGMLLIWSVNSVSSIPQLNELETFWPNTTSATAFIRDRVSGNDVVLLEGGDVISLGINNKISSDQIIGPFWFEYKGLEKEAAYVKAVEEKYFKLIEIENVYFDKETIAKIEQAAPTRYTKTFDDGRIRVYERIE